MASIISQSVAETFECGRLLGESLKGGEILVLSGDLGAGKTHLIKGIAAGLGHLEEVTSPTFTLIHEYLGGRLPLYHFDFYRLESPDDALGIGLDDYLSSSAVVAIEWGEKFRELLPADALWITLRALDGDRREIEGVGG